MYHPQFRFHNPILIYYPNFTNKNIKNIEPSDPREQLNKLNNPIITDEMAKNNIEYAIKLSKEKEMRFEMEM
jgi:hypothetical protein